MVAAQAGDKKALLQMMTDQTTNVYGECHLVLKDWPAGNVWEWYLGMTIQSHYHLWSNGLALAFIRSFQTPTVSTNC